MGTMLWYGCNGESGVDGSVLGQSGSGGAAALAFGFGGQTIVQAAANGNPGRGYGGGGSGAMRNTAAATAYDGGSGAPGVILIEEYALS